MKNRQTAQASTELLVIIGVVLIVLSAVVFLIQDSSGQLSGWWQQRNVAAWQKAPIGIDAMYYNGTHLQVVVTNNHRSEITKVVLYLDGVALTGSQDFPNSSQSIIFSGEIAASDLKASYEPSFEYNYGGLSSDLYTLALGVRYPVQT